MHRFLNIETRKVGGLRFLFIGRLTFMFCVSRRDRYGRHVEARNYAPITIEH